MNEFGVLFIRQAKHQKFRIAEFVLKKLGINYLSESEFEEGRIVVLHMIHFSAGFEE